MAFNSRLQTEAICRRLATDGFRQFDPLVTNSSAGLTTLTDRYRGKSDRRIIYPDETVLYDGNIRVFLRTDPSSKDNPGGRVLICYDNPVCAQKDLHTPRQFVYIRFRKGDVDRHAEELAAKLRPISEAVATPTDGKHKIRAAIHIHTGTMPNGELFFDDGVSNVSSIIRWAMATNVRVLAITSHNDFNLEHYQVLKEACNQVGITLIPAIELTATISMGHFNGPHILVLADSVETAQEIHDKILSKRQDMRMPSFARYDGLDIDDIFRILVPMQAQGKVVLGAAHPFNGLPSNTIGLMSAVIGDPGLLSPQIAVGQLTWRDAWDFLLQCRFTEINASLESNVLRIDDLSMRKELERMISKHIPGVRKRHELATPMNLNVALAYSAKQFGLGSSAGTDEHTTPPFTLGYSATGSRLAAMHTDLFLPSDFDPSQITVQRIVSGIANQTIAMEASIALNLVDGALEIPSESVAVPPSIKKTAGDLKFRQTLNYANVILRDMFANSDLREIWYRILHVRD